MSTKIFLYSSDNGRKVYKVTHTYTIHTEEFVKVAAGEDPFDIWLDQGGIDNSQISQQLLHEGPHTEAAYAEAFSNGAPTIEYMGTVVPEYDEEYTDEIIDHILDDTIPENEQKEVDNETA
jgi:hypothetical protein